MTTNELTMPRVAEFFAGMGLVREALDGVGFRTVFANDIDDTKRRLYVDNFGEAGFLRADIRDLRGDDVPEVEVATASFPCTDLSLAGNRAGLAGEHSGLFFEFVRVLREMGDRKPQVVLLENVLGFATSQRGDDLRAALTTLNELGYWCDVLVVDAAWFVPQSRQRLFIVGSRQNSGRPLDLTPSPLRPQVVGRALAYATDLQLHDSGPSEPRHPIAGLSAMVERLAPDDERWWDAERTRRFVASLSELQAERLRQLKHRVSPSWRTAYRRTRNGVAVWEIRPDEIAGALRTARGGSSKQALVETGGGEVRVRWMTAREYARLQGAPGFRLDSVTPSQAMFALGDAVCVPAVAWLGETRILPSLDRVGGRAGSASSTA